MSNINVVLLLGVLIFGIVLISRWFASVPSGVPCAHWSAPYSPLWILYQRYWAQENRNIYSAHSKYGPIIRLSPYEISVNDYEGGVRSIYGKNLRKHPWYLNIFANYGVQNNFCMQENKDHAQHRRLLAKMYSRSSVLSGQSFYLAWKRILWESALGVLENAAENGQAVDVVQFGAAYGVDFVTSFLYGSNVGSRFLHDLPGRERWFQAYEVMKKGIFWVGEVPGMVDFFAKIGIDILPSRIEDSVKYIGDWNLAMCRRARELEQKSETPSSSIFSQFDQILIAEKSDHTHLHPDRELVVASELLDQTTAALDGIAGVLSYAFYELSRPENSHIQHRLRTEVQSISLTAWKSGMSTDWGAHLPNPKACDGLPLLEAVVYETLRLYPPASGSLPRVTPNAGTHILGFDLPAGVRISCSAYTLHRNADIFPDPCSWMPQRWIDIDVEQEERMRRWWFPFGSGPRTCLGMHLVLLMVKWMLAVTYDRFETSLDSQDYQADMQPTDGFVGRPSGDKCLIVFSKLHKRS